MEGAWDALKDSSRRIFSRRKATQAVDVYEEGYVEDTEDSGADGSEDASSTHQYAIQGLQAPYPALEVVPQPSLPAFHGMDQAPIGKLLTAEVNAPTVSNGTAAHLLRQPASVSASSLTEADQHRRDTERTVDVHSKLPPATRETRSVLNNLGTRMANLISRKNPSQCSDDAGERPEYMDMRAANAEFADLLRVSDDHVNQQTFFIYFLFVEREATRGWIGEMTK